MSYTLYYTSLKFYDAMRDPYARDFVVGLIIWHLAYVLITSKQKEVSIVKKYKYNAYGFTEFMFIDSYGKHYNVKNSVWYLKWNSIEDWNSFEPNDKIKIKYYGWRIPCLGVFPIVVSTNK